MKAFHPIMMVLVVLVAGASDQQQEADTEILLGGILLRLGMSQDEALESLGTVYELRHVDNVAGNWSVLRRGGPPYRSVGGVAFKDQKLIFVNKHWGPDAEPSADALAKAFYGAVQSVTAGGSRSCDVSGRRVDEAGWNTEIRCGRRTVSVFAGGTSVESEVGETLNLNPQ